MTGKNKFLFGEFVLDVSGGSNIILSSVLALGITGNFDPVVVKIILMYISMLVKNKGFLIVFILNCSCLECVAHVECVVKM